MITITQGLEESAEPEEMVRDKDSSDYVPTGEATHVRAEYGIGRRRMQGEVMIFTGIAWTISLWILLRGPDFFGVSWGLYLVCAWLWFAVLLGITWAQCIGRG